MCNEYVAACARGQSGNEGECAWQRGVLGDGCMWLICGCNDEMNACGMGWESTKGGAGNACVMHGFWADCW